MCREGEITNAANKYRRSSTSASNLSLAIQTKAESVLEDLGHKILCDFEIKKNYLIPVGRPDSFQVDKNLWTVPAHHRVKEKEQNREILRSDR